MFSNKRIVKRDFPFSYEELINTYVEAHNEIVEKYGENGYQHLFRLECYNLIRIRDKKNIVRHFIANDNFEIFSISKDMAYEMLASYAFLKQQEEDSDEYYVLEQELIEIIELIF